MRFFLRCQLCFISFCVVQTCQGYSKAVTTCIPVWPDARCCWLLQNEVNWPLSVCAAATCQGYSEPGCRRHPTTFLPFLLLQNEIVLRCQLGPYQSALYELVTSKLRDEEGAAGVKGINNTVMELRNICNHPLLRLVVGEVHLLDLQKAAAPVKATLRPSRWELALTHLAACASANVLLFVSFLLLAPDFGDHAAADNTAALYDVPSLQLATA